MIRSAITFILSFISQLYANCLYAPPLHPLQEGRIIQGFNGAHSHKQRLAYGVDIDLPEGSFIYAARGGKVLAIKEDFKLGGPSPRFRPFANIIIIEHKDGSHGLYAHLQYLGVLVKKGDLVKRNQLIGLSGCTGQCDGPHLHFEIYRGPNLKSRQTLEFQFLTNKGALRPQKGLTLTGYATEDSRLCP